jgi:hypothetical protein
MMGYMGATWCATGAHHSTRSVIGLMTGNNAVFFDLPEGRQGTMAARFSLSYFTGTGLLYFFLLLFFTHDLEVALKASFLAYFQSYDLGL